MKIGQVSKLDIQWRHLVFGFYENIAIHKFRNLIIKVILYSIYKTWLSGLESIKDYTSKNLWYARGKDLLIWKETVKNLNVDKRSFNFPQIWLSIIDCLDILDIMM